jgi:hypothetical protein
VLPFTRAFSSPLGSYLLQDCPAGGAGPLAIQQVSLPRRLSSVALAAQPGKPTSALSHTNYTKNRPQRPWGIASAQPGKQI